jgi:serine/threonine protein phosphatase PrpC
MVVFVALNKEKRAALQSGTSRETTCARGGHLALRRDQAPRSRRPLQRKAPVAASTRRHLAVRPLRQLRFP